MSKKNNKKYKAKAKETTIEDFYDLKTQEMDELVAALKGEVDIDAPVPTANIAEITGEADVIDAEGRTRKRKKRDKEFDPYKRDALSRIPRWIRAFFIKFWFFGLVCYFVCMGLGTYVTDSLDQLVLAGVVTGIVVDCLVNPIFRMMESDKKEWNVYMMFPFPFKHFWTFFTNIIYYVLVMVGVSYAYVLLNLILTGGTTTINVAMEPLLFGIFALIIDMACIGVKDLIVYLIKKAVHYCKNKKREMAEEDA